MFWVIRFVLFWTVWLVFADKKRWREIIPVSVFASFLSSSSDNIMHQYHLWVYDTEETSFIADMTDDWSVYLVIAYLFIQWLPKEQTLGRMLKYMFLWTGVVILIEYIHVASGHMTYSYWWNIHLSYFADWILFVMIYQYHKIFHFERLL